MGGVCPKGLAVNKTCPRGLRLAITLSRGQKMKISCPKGGFRTCSSIGGLRIFNGIAQCRVCHGGFTETCVRCC